MNLCYWCSLFCMCSSLHRCCFQGLFCFLNMRDKIASLLRLRMYLLRSLCNRRTSLSPQRTGIYLDHTNHIVQNLRFQNNSPRNNSGSGWHSDWSTALRCSLCTGLTQLTSISRQSIPSTVQMPASAKKIQHYNLCSCWRSDRRTALRCSLCNSPTPWTKIFRQCTQCILRFWAKAKRIQLHSPNSRFRRQPPCCLDTCLLHIQYTGLSWMH